MKRTGRVLDEFFGRVPKSSQKQMDEAYSRMWERVWLESPALPGAEALDTDVPQRRRPRWILVAATAVALLLITGIAYREIRDRRYAAQVAIEVVDGAVLRVSDRKLVNTGERVEGGELVRSNDSASIALADGSRVETRAQSEFSVDHADGGVRIHLRTGGLIVNAAKQHTGRLYVQTKDVTVSVVGTVFLVNSEEEGSRVAVIEGAVRDQQGGPTKNLLSGEQLSSNPSMKPLPVKTEVSWSQNAEVHVALLQQSTTAAAAPKRLEFEVVSVKKDVPIGPGNIPGGGAPECRGVDGRFGSTATQNAPLGRCTGRHVSLMWLIDAAYGLSGQAPARVIGLEPWMRDLWNEGFQIDAVSPDPASATKAQLQQMLQSMLADRFKLQITWEKREVSQTVLVVAARGPKLRETSEAGTLIATNRVVEGGREFRVTGNGSMKAFVEALAPITLVDRTELKGIYAFNFSYVIPSMPARPAGEGGPRGGGGPGGQGQPWLDALRDALQDQLGLRMDSINVPADFVIIEHAEKPSEN